jgi:hypothetical protein
MKNYQKMLAVIALSGMCLAGTAPQTDDTASKTKKKAHAAKAMKAEPVKPVMTPHPVRRDETAEKLRELKEVVDQQQSALQAVQQQLQQTQQQLQQTQQQLKTTQQTAQQADAKAIEVENSSNLKVQKIQADLGDVKTALDANTVIVKEDEKKVEYLEHPASIAYKGIRITPGGFLEMTTIYRQHATLSDQATPFSGIPLEGWGGGSSTSTASGENPNLSEFGFTARDSRITLRADADAGKTKLAGYFEMDFFGTTPTANLSQTSSYAPRLRQAWGRAKFDNGFTITGGQMWNLITLNRKGTDSDNSNVWIPNIIEAQYSVGYDWGRFAEFRLSQQFGKKVNVAVGLTNPTMLSSANNTTGTVSGVASLGNGLLGNSITTSCALPSATVTSTSVVCTNTPLYSTNLAPDVIVKVAFDDAKIGHYELKTIGRVFRDRVVPGDTVLGVPVTSGYDNYAYGYGYGAGAVIPVISKKVDLILQGLYGKGISRYEDSGQYDVVIRTSGSDFQMQPLKSYSFLGGFETHPTPKVEIDALFGQEHYYQDIYTTDVKSAAGTAASLAGYGLPTTSVTGCFNENATAAAAAGRGDACAPNNKTLWNAKLFGYYDLYKGTKGTLRYGVEVDYIERTTWAGSTPAATLLPAGGTVQVLGNDKTGFMTMRYIFP